MRRTIVAISTAITLATLSGAQADVQTIEADNGEVYHIVQITHGRGGQAAADVSAPDGNLNISFDCDGHMTVYSYGAHAFGPMQMFHRVAWRAGLRRSRAVQSPDISF